MKRKQKIILWITMILIVGFTSKTQAALQANTGTQYTKTGTPGNWMTWFRQMEQAGQAMGLSETLNSDLTSTTSNGIDVHMMRSTEYGAMAILSMSGYGNSSNAQVITTTSGNNTGVILNTNDKMEYVAGSLSGKFSANTRYYDVYTTENSSAKVGDALGTCVGWHNASFKDWISSTFPVFRRGRGGVFSFGYHGGDNSIHNTYYCRGVAVCGEGL